MTVDLANIIFVVLSVQCLFISVVFFSLSTYSGEQRTAQSQQFTLLACIFFCFFCYGLICTTLETFEQFFLFENGVTLVFLICMIGFYSQCKRNSFASPVLYLFFIIITVWSIYCFNISPFGQVLVSNHIYLAIYHLLAVICLILAIEYLIRGVAPLKHRKLLSFMTIYIGMVANLTPYVDGGSTIFWLIRAVDLVLISYILFWILLVNSTLHRESVRFKLAFEQAQVAVLMLQSDNQISYQNNTFISRYNPFQKNMAEELPFINSILSVVDRRIENQEGWQGQSAFKVGEENITVQIYAHGLYNAKGEVLLKVFSILDTTEQSRYKNLLESYGKQLSELSAKLLEIQETERAHIARELHDDIGQQLTLLKFSISSVQGMDNQKALLEKVEAALESVRGLSRQLRPAILDEMGLPTALEWLVRQLENTETTITLAIKEPYFNISHPMDINFFRLIQEIVNNALKHANANEIQIKLLSTPDSIRLTVSDDGDGFDVSAKSNYSDNSVSFGLLSIRERVKLTNGRMDLVSAPGEGTQYIIEAFHE